MMRSWRTLEESDIDDFSWDTLLIEDEDEATTTGWSD